MGLLLGGYVFARQLNLGRIASTLVGTWMGLGGYAVSMTELTHSKLAAAAVPWYWASLRWSLEGPRWRWAVPPIAMGLILLAGDPEIAISCSAAGLVLVVVRRREPAWLVALGAPILGGAVAAVQWIPAALCAVDSERAHADAGGGRVSVWSA